MNKLTPIDLAQNSETDVRNTTESLQELGCTGVIQWHKTRAMRLHEQAALAWHDQDTVREEEKRRFSMMHERFADEIERLRRSEAKLHWLLGNITRLVIDTIPTGDGIEAPIHKITLMEHLKAAELTSAIKALDALIAEDRQMR
jgi:hypothetical protein